MVSPYKMTFHLPTVNTVSSIVRPYLIPDIQGHYVLEALIKYYSDAAYSCDYRIINFINYSTKHLLSRINEIKSIWWGGFSVWRTEIRLAWDLIWNRLSVFSFKPGGAKRERTLIYWHRVLRSSITWSLPVRPITAASSVVIVHSLWLY